METETNRELLDQYIWSPMTHNPYTAGTFYEKVDQRWDKSGKGHNLFYRTHSMELPYYLWGCSWAQREYQEGMYCVETYSHMPEMPMPVSASVMAKRWGCSHTWARKLILGSWDWVGVADRWYIHSSWVDEGSWIYRACLEAPHTLSCLEAVNRLRGYTPQDGDARPASYNSVGDWVGVDAFVRLKAAGILESTLSLNNRHKMYYVPNQKPTVVEARWADISKEMN